MARHHPSPYRIRERPAVGCDQTVDVDDVQLDEQQNELQAGQRPRRRCLRDLAGELIFEVRQSDVVDQERHRQGLSKWAL